MKLGESGSIVPYVYIHLCYIHHEKNIHSPIQPLIFSSLLHRKNVCLSNANLALLYMYLSVILYKFKMYFINMRFS